MFLDSFKLISLNSQYWKGDISEVLKDNHKALDKIAQASGLMQFLTHKISIGEAKIDKNPSLYVLRVRKGQRNITSIIGAIRYDEKKILFPNENTHPEKLKGYSNLFSKYKLQINPLLTFYKKGPSIHSLIGEFLELPPKIEAEIQEVEYKLWRIKDSRKLLRIKENMAEIEKVYIADGHHRFSIFQNLPNKTSKIMVALTDSRSICLKSCHRVIIGPIDPLWVQKLSKYCRIEKEESALLLKDIIICFRSGERYKILFKPELINEISVYFAVNNIIFKESFGITNMEERIFPLPGDLNVSDTNKIFELYQNSSVIVFIPELDISEFFKIVDRGDKLPPTSTWFEPKIIDGFLISQFG